MEILARYLEHTDRPVYALVRASDQGVATRRLRRTLRCPVRPRAPLRRTGGGGARGRHQGRPRARPAGVAAGRPHRRGRPRRGLGVLRAAARRLAGDQRRRHPADARVRRAVPGDRGRACGASPTSPRHTWRASTPAPSARTTTMSARRFRNPYERSKFEAEGIVKRWRSRMPVTVVRPSIVVGEQDSGWTPVFNVIYWPLRAFSRGAYRVLPARASAPVDVVPVDYVADATFALSPCSARRRCDLPSHRRAARQQRGRAGRPREHLLRPPRPAAASTPSSTGGCCTR